MPSKTEPDFTEKRWFHGIHTKTKRYLKQSGDFLVHADISRSFKSPDVVLCVRAGEETVRYPLVTLPSGRVCLREHVGVVPRADFSSVYRLVAHFRHQPLPCGYVLRHGVRRPDFLLQHKSVLFDPSTDKLGSGNFCDVYRGRFVDQSGVSSQAAIKVCRELNTRNEKQEQAGVVETVRSMMNEAKLQFKFRNECVVQCFGIACDNLPVMLAVELWMAPETLCKRPEFTFHSDVWAFGVLLFETFNGGEMPWPGDADFRRMARRIRALQMPPLPPATPEVVRRLVGEKIWLKDPQQRADFGAILRVLVDFLYAHRPELPPWDAWFVNRANGVLRKKFLKGNKEELLKDDRVPPTSHSSLSNSKKRPAPLRRRASGGSTSAGFPTAREAAASPEGSGRVTKRAPVRRKPSATQSVSREE
ncbi:Tyrosine-protein kinase [Aphelenchoides fujianensis]|nr:Tyrosine-protein kinase [Aphelenchoides fujianensis]